MHSPASPAWTNTWLDSKAPLDLMLLFMKKKTDGMDACGCHGGLVFDEIKLSENISVKSSGKLCGFVDLGPFGEDNDSTVSDHGLVIMYQPFQGK